MTINYQFGVLDAYRAVIRRPPWRGRRSAGRISPTWLPLANFGADARVDRSSTPSWAAASR
jgi:hypothetical protein